MVRPPYEAVLRLFANAERYWAAIDGEAASQGGVDYFSLPLDRFCNAIQWWCLQRVKDPERFLRDLEAPLSGSARTVTQDDLEADGAAFMAFAKAFGVKPPAPVGDETATAALPSA